MGIPFLDIPDVGGAAEGFLEQKFGIKPEQLAGFLRGPRGVPTTRTRLSHAYTLQTAKGQKIGAVYRAQENQGRTVDTEWEIDVNAHGEPADLVPQELSERTFSIARWDLYDRVMEEIFGTAEIEMLTDQAVGFKLREVWRAPSSILNSRGRQYEYLNCFFTRRGRVVETTGDRTVRVDADLVWLRRRKVA